MFFLNNLKVLKKIAKAARLQFSNQLKHIIQTLTFYLLSAVAESYFTFICKFLLHTIFSLIHLVLHNYQKLKFINFNSCNISIFLIPSNYIRTLAYIYLYILKQKYR